MPNKYLELDTATGIIKQALPAVASAGVTSGGKLVALDDNGVLDSSVLPTIANMPNPMTTEGDLIRGGTSGAATRLGIGINGQILTVVDGIPAWSTLPPGAYAVDIGDGVSTSITVTHSLGTRDVLVAVRRNSDYTYVQPQSIVASTTNAVVISFASAPSSNEYRAIVLKSGGSGGGGSSGSHVYNEIPSGSINGSNTVFSIAGAAIPGTLRVYRKPSGGTNHGGRLLPTTDYTENGGSDVTGGMTAIEDSHWSSHVAANAIDDDSSTAWASNINGAGGWVGVDFGASYSPKINRVRFQIYLPSGYGGIATYRIDYSDNGSSWTAHTGTLTVPSNADNVWVDTGVLSTPAAGHRYWRLYALSTATWDASVRELEMFDADDNSTVSSFTMVNAPASGDTLLVDYDVA